MRMGYYNNYFAAFFFESFITHNEKEKFILAMILIFLHMFTYTLVSNLFKKSIFTKVVSPFFMFFNMFIIMCYNRWIILVYILAETLGYLFFRIIDD